MAYNAMRYQRVDGAPVRDNSRGWPAPAEMCSGYGVDAELLRWDKLWEAIDSLTEISYTERMRKDIDGDSRARADLIAAAPSHIDLLLCDGVVSLER